MSVIALILARGGSKGIPKKNILSFCDKPLIQWSIIQAKLSKEVDRVFVSSDSDEILRIAKNTGAEIIKRPTNISGDEAKSEEAILHALDVLGNNYEIIVMLEPTAPLRKPTDLDSGIVTFREQKLDSAFSSAELQDFLIWKKNKEGVLSSINYDYKNQQPRQQREKDYVENGAIYLFKPEIILKYNNRFGGKIGMLKNDFWQSFEIDEKDDWEFVELIFRHYLENEYLKLLKDNSDE